MRSKGKAFPPKDPAVCLLDVHLVANYGQPLTFHSPSKPTNAAMVPPQKSSQMKAKDTVQ